VAKKISTVFIKIQKMDLTAKYILLMRKNDLNLKKNLLLFISCMELYGKKNNITAYIDLDIKDIVLIEHHFNYEFQHTGEHFICFRNRIT